MIIQASITLQGFVFGRLRSGLCGTGQVLVIALALDFLGLRRSFADVAGMPTNLNPSSWKAHIPNFDPRVAM